MEEMMRIKPSLLIFLLGVLLAGTLNAQESEWFGQKTDEIAKWNAPEKGVVLKPSNGGDDWNLLYNGTKDFLVAIGDREVPLNTPRGIKPNEQQVETIKRTITDDFLVNDDDGSADQFIPSIAMDALGNFVIVWYDSRNANWDIYFQRYNNAGLAQGVNTKVNDDTQDASQEHPSIAMDPTGNFVIVWDDNRNNNYDIYFQRYTSTGGVLGANTKVNDDVDGAKQWDPSISMDATGSFVLVWIDERNVDRDIYCQSYNSIGGALGINTKVNDDAGNADQIAPSISLDLTGNFVIVWHDFRNDDWDIYFQRYNSSGGVISVNTKVNDDAGSNFQMYSAISMDVLGDFVIAWQDFRNVNWDIYFQRYTSEGTALGANIKVNDDAGNMNQKLPSIALNDVGDFVIVWQDNRYGQNNTDIMGQRYYSSGNPNGGNYRIVADGPNNGEISPVVVADNLSIIFSWQDNRRSEGWDIYAKIVSWDWNGVITDVAEGNINPKDFSLSQNYPNPFNSATNIRFSLTQFDHVNLSVFNTSGQKVATLVNEKLSAGTYNFSFYDQNLPSGIYLYKLTTGSGYTQVKIMVKADGG